MIEYNEENLKLVSDLIVKNLTPDLIPVKWRQRNSINPMFGHCHTAAACLQKIFTTKLPFRVKAAGLPQHKTPTLLTNMVFAT